MSKDKISDYSATANSNTDIAGINIDEGCAPSGINNAIRTLMKQIKDLYAGTSGDKWPVTAGGTGATTAADARTNLGLAIGTDVQAYDAQLTDIAGLTPTDNGVVIGNGTNFVVESGATLKTSLGLTIGTDVQAYNAELQGISQGGNIGFKNRIINGAMMIDQRNAGASVTPADITATYITDRFFFVKSSTNSPTLQQVSDAPTGFKNSLKFTNSNNSVTPNYAQIVQRIEGFNTADLGFGVAGASTITLSFWVKSSVTGTYSVALRNSASDRSYVSTYTISSANTWEQKTVTVAGDTSGTWVGATNGTGLEVIFRFGGTGGTSTLNAWTATGDAYASGSVNVMATANSTWAITGVQLEKGSTATSFDYRPYGTELALCQRYYYRIVSSGSSANILGVGLNDATTTAQIQFSFPVTMRTSPTSIEQSGTATNYALRTGAGATTCSAVPAFVDAGQYTATVLFTVASGLTTGGAVLGRAATAGAYIGFPAEL